MSASTEPRRAVRQRALLLACAVLLPAAASQAALSREQAAAIVAQGPSDRVLAVEAMESNGRAAWRVKILTATGDVKVVVLDAGHDAGLRTMPPAGSERWPDWAR